MYVADQGNHAIRRIGVDGVVTTVAGSGRRGKQDGEALKVGAATAGSAVPCRETAWWRVRGSLVVLVRRFMFRWTVCSVHCTRRRF